MRCDSSYESGITGAFAPANFLAVVTVAPFGPVGCPYPHGRFTLPLSVLPEYFGDSVRGILTLLDH